ncbi:cysteine desulfurase family protein [Halalkalibacter sp. APA_J-10(15)]|uniref:cysteine desulfurase family protein n=1 Tax=Halalkalibacter sp. APA_J-10(15) TaxID=2933805 RepID=UPI001FF64B73|nr:cysteine desulfurase family protein [Halalkalibacter sp. APA_J-10(15)]MCK0471313.1 cysteine desulfurase [Halalkalibacter sp. APA_J-10(15)]
MIYLDNSATTRPDPSVVETYMKASLGFFGNPSSLHTLGVEAERLLNEARNRVAAYLSVSSKEIIFTSGGTEGNNLAIKGAAKARKHRGKHIVTTAAEHASVLATCQSLEAEGFEVTYIDLDSRGFVSVESVMAAIRTDTVVVSIHHVNNEIGAIQPVEDIGKRLIAWPNVMFHVDHVQGLSKVPLSLNDAHIDLCTGSAHKIHGLKGTGFLYKRKGTNISPLQHGGNQEFNVRTGTENVAGAVALAKALRLMGERCSELKRLQSLRGYVINELKKIEAVILNSPLEGAPHIINVSLPRIKPEVVVQALAEKDIYVSTKSACSSKESEPSHVLKSMGLTNERTVSAIRISLSVQTTKEELDRFLMEFRQLIPELMEVAQS